MRVSKDAVNFISAAQSTGEWRIYRHKDGLILEQPRNTKTKVSKSSRVDYYVEMENGAPKSYLLELPWKPGEFGRCVRLRCVRNAAFPSKDGDWSPESAPEGGYMPWVFFIKNYRVIADNHKSD